MDNVAPLAGAWIEICSLDKGNTASGSRPSRARGLKCTQYELKNTAFVAPLAGAWIEMRVRAISRQGEASRPSRARGLK